MRILKTSFFLIAVISVLLMATGCSDDDPVQVQDDPATGPESPDVLMSLIMAAHETRNVSQYLALLDPEFQMFLSDETRQEFPTVGPTLDYAEEEWIHTRMFSGENVTNPEGNLVPGVQGISFYVFMPMDAWTPTVEGDPIEDAVWAPYQVVIHFDRGQTYSTMKVEGVVNVFARAHEITVAGKKETFYLLAGMTDLTYFAKGTETASWGSIKAWYR